MNNVNTGKIVQISGPVIDVLACLADKFEIIDRKEEKGWVALAAKLK